MEHYPDQFTPYEPHMLVNDPDYSRWISPEELCYASCTLLRTGDIADALEINQVMIATLVANGWIETTLRREREQESE